MPKVLPGISRNLSFLNSKTHTTKTIQNVTVISIYYRKRRTDCTSFPQGQRGEKCDGGFGCNKKKNVFDII